MVVDARTELASPDYDLVRLLGRSNKPVFLAVNKVEGEAMADAAENFRQLGHPQCLSPSARNMALGIGDLLDAISEAIPAPERRAPRLRRGRAAEEAEISEGGPLEPGAEDDRTRQLHPHPRRI